MNTDESVIKNLIKMVAEDKIMLSDDPQQLMPKPDLIEVIRHNSNYSKEDINDFFNNRLILTIDENEQLYHAGITMNFLTFQKRLEITGFSLQLKQKIAQMYYSLFWALVTDIEHEIDSFKVENDRNPTKLELAFLRLTSEWAVADTMSRIEERILKLESEGDEELQQMIDKAAQKKKALIKKAKFGYQESQIRNMIEEIWSFPSMLYQGREIKAFIDIDSFDCNKEERKLLWGGHFDFSLCDKDGILQLAIEYNGSGHYGQSKQSQRQINIRDSTKKSICIKAGVPLIVLTPEFAFLAAYNSIFKKFLHVFKAKQDAIDIQNLHDVISEPFNFASVQRIKIIEKMGRDQLDNALQRLQIYRIQKRKDLLLALLWEVYIALEDLSTLNSILDSFTNKSI